jgi:hypothetical protein
MTNYNFADVVVVPFPFDRSHAPAWECLRRRSASCNRAAGAAKAAFPRRAWERSNMQQLFPAADEVSS